MVALLLVLLLVALLFGRIQVLDRTLGRPWQQQARDRSVEHGRDIETALADAREKLAERLERHAARTLTFDYDAAPTARGRVLSDDATREPSLSPSEPGRTKVRDAGKLFREAANVVRHIHLTLPGDGKSEEGF